MEYKDTKLTQAQLDQLAAQATELNSALAPDGQACVVELEQCQGEGWFEASTDLADLMFDLAHQAYSCLCNTPQGLPGNGFYIWDNLPDPGCCDELVVWLSGLRPYNCAEGFGSDAYTGPSALCDDIVFAPEITISLMRSCRPVFNNDGTDLSSSQKRLEHGYNAMVDLRTLTCCLQECLVDESILGRSWDKEFYFGRASMSGQSHCTRIDIPMVFDLGACCPTHTAAP